MELAPCRLPESGPAARYATSLLEGLGVAVEPGAAAPEPHPALAWARSGAMALTGLANGPPRVAPAGVAVVADGAAAALGALAVRRGRALAIGGAALLAARAAEAGLERRGRTSVGGATRLLAAADGWIAVALARPEDRAALPAWLEEPCGGGEPWRFVAARVGERAVDELVARARLLGLPVAPAAAPDPVAPPWLRVAARGPRLERAPGVRPLVIDLSALWAGPLCTQLLRRAAGARVLRVESRSRAQAPRSGYFARLDAGVERVALDLGVASGRDALHRLLERADIVVESARPRALRQLGVEAEAWVAARPGLTWVAISGYGRREPRAGWVAFGDDAAAAAGLAELAGRGTDGPLFCADAVADPLTGLHASVAALVHHEQGGGVLLDLSLRDVAAQATRFADAAEGARVVATRGGHAVLVGGARAAVAAPRPRRLARARRAVAGLASAAPGPRACARAPKRSLA